MEFNNQDKNNKDDKIDLTGSELDRNKQKTIFVCWFLKTSWKESNITLLNTNC